MKPIYRNVSVDVLDIIKDDLPYTSIFYVSEGLLERDVENLFSFPIANQSHMPFYTFPYAKCDYIIDTFNDVYTMMREALGKLFNTESMNTVKQFYSDSLLENHPYFWDYAKFTFNQNHPAIYGRFDASFDPVTHEVKGIYEFNGDTPVMLFESVHMENRYIRQLDQSGYSQINEYYSTLSNFVSKTFKKNETIGVVYDPRYIEDAVTCETLAQIFGEHCTCLVSDFQSLDYERKTSNNKPFFIKDEQLTRLFVLSPWEEMVANFPEAFANWQTWGANTYFMEPAWRWFMSNKGLWAYITHLMETDSNFKGKYGHLPYLKTYMSPDVFLASGQKYVSKPLIGRLSNNITIYEGCDISYQSDGFYSDSPMVYQEYCEPCKVEGRNNFILGMWMAPIFEDNGRYELGSTAVTLCIREFDNPVLSVSNERFIPHLLIHE
jgi:glutathionylspermidine synthase